MSKISKKNIVGEYLNFLRNSDILTTTQRSVTTTIDTFTSTLTGAETFTLTHLDAKNIRVVTYDGTPITWITNYTYNIDSATVTLLAVVPAKTVTVQYDYGTDHIHPDFPRCFTDSAELLTTTGFKRIDDTLEDELVLTYNLKDNIYEYKPIIKKIKEEYTGEMYHIKNGQIDTIVTPNHRFIVRDGNNLNSKKILFRTSEELKIGNRIIRTANWVGNDIEYIKLLEDKKKFYLLKKELIINIDDYVALLGIYLAEGSINRYGGVVISQYKESGRKKIKELLDRIGLHYSIGKDGFNISDYRLGDIFKKYGTDCYTKFIPQEIKDLPSNRLEILLKWLILGDGAHIDKSDNSWEYYTTSKQLSDDVQEITLKTGRSTKYDIKKNNKFSTCDCYRIKIYGNRYKNMRLFRQNITKLNYTGYIYCVNTSNSTIVVRDNKKVFISGNSDLTISSYPRIAFGVYGMSSEIAGFGNVNRSTWRFDTRIYATSQTQADTLLDNLRSEIIDAQNSMQYCSYIKPTNVLDLGIMELDKGHNKIYVIGLDVSTQLNYEIN